MALSERQRLRGALVAAAALHVGVAWLAFRAPAPAAIVPFRDPGADDLLWLEPLATGSASESASPPLPAPADSEASAGPSSLGRSSGRKVVMLDREPRPSSGEVPGEGSVEAEAAPPSEGAGRADGANGGGPRLSLDQLGIGKNPFVTANGTKPGERPRRSSQGLRRSIAESIVKHEQRIGLGPEGPILKLLETEIRQSTTSPNSQARFRASIDRRGNLVAFEVLEATTDHRPWRELAARVLKALRGTALRVPKTGRGLSVDIAIESRVQLPSGADPGLAVDVLGIPVKKGGGERSHKISILSVDPGGRELTIRGPGGQLIHIPEPPKVVLFGLGFDPVDIGAPAQRVVRSHVESVSSEDIPDAEPAPEPPGPSPQRATVPDAAR